ncbi:MAG: LarC family nickel insertion protein [Proteobacteria bacterium]|nr:LarC family nickel insertion protein [Pseudomonadota bacterium]
MVNHIHLDLVGGLSGDMFISSMLDAFPKFREGLGQVIVDAGFPDLVELETVDHDDGTLTGTRFTVTSTEQEGHHHHRHYSDIRGRLQDSNLETMTRDNALAIFRLIAEVEAAIHGKKVEDVAFHEVGAWDSIADIVLAAHLIASVDADSWSISAIPAGRGFVETAHGRLPIPAPATARLLEGFELLDDGLEGERVTPTGAAIIKFLSPLRRLPPGLVLKGTGYGFGRKVFPGISNTVRVAVFTASEADLPWTQDQVMRLSFELDDQTPESIADALERLRGMDGVLEVTQHAYWGKKQRQGFSITVLCRPGVADTVTSQCFTVTTTLGVRRELTNRATLPRQEVVVSVGERSYRVKVSRRPEGYTAKVEMDDLLAGGLSLQEQASVRGQAESLAIEQAGNH